MKTIKVMRDGRPATTNELQCAVDGKPLPPLVEGKTGMGIFDGSIHEVTYQAGDGESDEGWSTAEAASGDKMLLQIYGRRGDEARISLTAQQAWALKIRLEYASMELTARKNAPPLCQQCGATFKAAVSVCCDSACPMRQQAQGSK